MNFETVLFAAAFLLLAVFSYPGEQVAEEPTAEPAEMEETLSAVAPNEPEAPMKAAAIEMDEPEDVTGAN